MEESTTFPNVVVPHKSDAERLHVFMLSMIVSYDQVSVADLYEVAGVPTRPSDALHGWRSLEGIRITPDSRHGYILVLPDPIIL